MFHHQSAIINPPSSSTMFRWFPPKARMGEVGEEPPVDPSLEQLRRGVGTVGISPMWHWVPSGKHTKSY